MVEGKPPEDWHRGDGTKVEVVYIQSPPRLVRRKAEGVSVATNRFKYTVVTFSETRQLGMGGRCDDFPKVGGQVQPRGWWVKENGYFSRGCGCSVRGHRHWKEKRVWSSNLVSRVFLLDDQ